MDKATLLLTRPAASSVRFAVQLDPKLTSRADLVISPLLEIVQLNVTIDLSGYAGVIFTSANGVAHGPTGEGLPAYCVGHRTAEAAKAKGWHVERVALDADALTGQLRESDDSGPLLHLAGTYQRGDIAERLTAFGHPTDRLATYDQRAQSLSDSAQKALCGEVPVILPLFSKRTAAQLVAQACDLSRAYVVAISADVASELEGRGVADLRILPQPTGAAMVRAVELLVSSDRLP